MKLSQKIALSLAILAATGAALIIAGRRRRCSDNERMLDNISEEGYETANDVLFPGKNIHSKNLKYGPVLPN